MTPSEEAIEAAWEVAEFVCTHAFSRESIAKNILETVVAPLEQKIAELEAENELQRLSIENYKARLDGEGITFTST